MPTIAETWLEQGRLEGEKQMLIRVLEMRFGPLPERYRTRIGTANENLLTKWLPRLWTAQKLQDILEPE
jgi:hypothetical protein